MNNMPELKIGIVAVSRDCFPESLSVSRREALTCGVKHRRNMAKKVMDGMSQLSVSLRARECIWYRPSRISKMRAVMPS